MYKPFTDRLQAGQYLAERLQAYANRSDVLVLALPRGGVPVGFEIAQALHTPLDVLLVRKLGVPGHEELAMGAIASNGVRVLNEEVVTALDIPPAVIEQVAAEERRELERRDREYRDGRPPQDVSGKSVILVDDGLATGSTMRAAAQAVRAQHPARTVVAVPAAPPDVCREFLQLVDEVLCGITPEPFYGVGAWYQDFPQLTDAQVHEYLSKAARKELTH